MVEPTARGYDLAQHVGDGRSVRPRRAHRLFRTPDLRAGDHLHGARDLLRVPQ